MKPKQQPQAAARDLYQEVTDKVIAALEQGVMPWRRGWDQAAYGGPMNPTTGRPYRGINNLLLGLMQVMRFDGDPRWCSYRQAQERGWQVRGGERGTTVVFYRRIEKKPEKPYGDEAGDFYYLLRYSVVFHASQIDRIPEFVRLSAEAAGWRRPEAIDVILANSGADIRRVHVWGIGWQVAMFEAGAIKDGAHACCFMRGEVVHHPAGIARRFSNDDAGFKTIIAWLSDQIITRVVFEPTGADHHAFERSLGAAGLPLVKVNPRRQTRRFAEAIGQHAKTDAVDAAMLARFGSMIEPMVRPMISETLDAMKELLVARRALVKDRTATTNRAYTNRSPLLARQTSQRLRQIKRQITAIDAALATQCAADSALAARFDILMSIPGIGDITALTILIEMPELGDIEHQCVASLAGLAPIARDSGQHRGKRSIRGGRAQLRQALYMPALVATRFNRTMTVKYQTLIAAGKLAKVALTAIMRKLIILANALLKAGRKWQPQNA